MWVGYSSNWGKPSYYIKSVTKEVKVLNTYIQTAAHVDHVNEGLANAHPNDLTVLSREFWSGRIFGPADQIFRMYIHNI